MVERWQVTFGTHGKSPRKYRAVRVEGKDTALCFASYRQAAEVARHLNGECRTGCIVCTESRRRLV